MFAQFLFLFDACHFKWLITFTLGGPPARETAATLKTTTKKKSESWEIKLSLFLQMGFFIIFAICCTFGKKSFVPCIEHDFFVSKNLGCGNELFYFIG